MTRDEILKQAKEGGFAIVRLPIKKPPSQDDFLKFLGNDQPDGYTIGTHLVDGRFVGVPNASIVSTEQPPLSEVDMLKAQVERMDRENQRMHGESAALRARVEDLEKQLIALSAKPPVWDIEGFPPPPKGYVEPIAGPPPGGVAYLGTAVLVPANRDAGNDRPYWLQVNQFFDPDNEAGVIAHAYVPWAVKVPPVAPSQPPIPPGFTRHDGGPRPVEAGSLVEVVFSDGTTLKVRNPDAWVWRRGGDGLDIIAYRLIAPPHNLTGFGPIKAGPPPVDAGRGTFAAYAGGWYTGLGMYATNWQDATAHAMREG